MSKTNIVSNFIELRTGKQKKELAFVIWSAAAFLHFAFRQPL
jgi:hypothetical protein